MAVEAFFAKLPRGSLSAEEAQLRGLLVDAAAIAARLLPNSGSVSLQQWVERRIPGDIFLGPDKSGFCSLRVQKQRPAGPTQASSVNRDAFFASLGDTFTAGELRLHEAVVEFVSRGPAYLALMLKDPRVNQARSFLPQGILLEDWIERRIGAEVVLFDGPDGALKVKLAPPSKEDRKVQQDAFFETLPADSFSEAEIQLREAILGLVEQSGGSSTLSLIGGDKGVKAGRTYCLPDYVSMKEWMLRRIADDVSLGEAPNGQLSVQLTGSFQGAGKQQQQQQPGKGKKREASKMDEGMDEAQRQQLEEQRELENQAKEERRDQFFAELPSDSLLPGEMELREALVDFIETWRGAIPPSLSNCGSDARVSAGRASFLPKGIALRDWIDTRIGGELEVVRLEGHSECFIGKRDQIDEAALQKGITQLKVSRRAGGGQAGKGKGKGTGKGKAPALQGKGKAPVSQGKGKGKGKGHGGEAPAKRQRK